MIQAPVFMVGSERSGTTLLRLMMGSHPMIAANPEFDFSVEKIAPDGTFPGVPEYVAFLETDRSFQLYGFDIDPSLGYPELVDSFLRQRQRRENKPIVTATVHHHFDRLRSIWPDARFVYILRDPRDVAGSVIGMGWAGNFWTANERWLDAERIWERLSGRLADHEKLEIRYEDLILSTEATLTQVCDFYGVGFDRAVYDYAKNSTYDMPDPKLVAQWRTRLGARDLQLAEARLGDRLGSRGYPSSGLPAVTPSALRVRWLEWQDWWARARARMRLLGVPLFAADYFARRVGPKALEDRLRQRVHAKINATLR